MLLARNLSGGSSSSFVVFCEGLRRSWVLAQFLEFSPIDRCFDRVEVLFAVFLWFAEVNEKDEKQSFQSRGSRRC